MAKMAMRVPERLMDVWQVQSSTFDVVSIGRRRVAGAPAVTAEIGERYYTLRRSGHWTYMERRANAHSPWVVVRER